MQPQEDCDQRDTLPRSPHLFVLCYPTNCKHWSPSKLLCVDTVQPTIRQGPALVGVEIRDILQHKHWHAFAALGFDMLKVNTNHIVQPEWRSGIFLQITY